MNNRKRILALIEIFKIETDVNHSLKLKEIAEKLKSYSIFDINSKTLKEDIETLQQWGFEIQEYQEKQGVAKEYAFIGSEFEKHEIQILVDAVASGRFIPENISKSLTKKLINQLSSYEGKEIKKDLIINPLLKKEQKNIHIYIDKIHEATSSRNYISFHYCEINWKKEYVKKRHGQRYLVKPLGVIWNGSYYYLIAYFNDESEPRNYRIDRMSDVEIEERKFPTIDFDMNKYMQGSLKMFGTGEVITLHLKCKNTAVKGVVDEFGTSFEGEYIDENHCLIKVRAQDNDGLISWLMQWGTAIEVLKPVNIRNKVKERIEKMATMYEEK